jgi:flagellar protein FliS
MSSDIVRSAYQRIEANGSNSVQLVVMLYDGAIRFLGDAKSCADRGDRRGKATAITRTLAIIGELQSTLKLDEGGDIARSLDALYTYITEKILDASIKGNDRALDEAMKVLRTLNSAWVEIAKKAEVPANTTTDQGAASADHPAEAPLEFFG